MARAEAAAHHRPHRRLRPAIILTVAAGGAVGATARYELGSSFEVASGSFPWVTFAVNVSGSFLLGLLLTFVLERWPPTQYVRPFLAIGVLGTYTTFSTYSVEADLLFKDGHVAVGVVYVLASPAAGGVAVYLGILTARLRSPLRRSER
ncbi:MAG: fluoride efflux transporter CrcB [Acidimicrobiia bacterium]